MHDNDYQRLHVDICIDLILVNFIYSRCFYMELTIRSCNILLEQEICKIIVFSNILVKYILCVSTTKNSSRYWKILFFFVLFFLEVKVPEILDVLRTSSGNKVHSSDVCVQDKWMTNPAYPFVMIQCHVKRSTAQKMKFSIKYFFSKCDQIRRILEIFIFCEVKLTKQWICHNKKSALTTRKK